jgi:tight adherence protein B
MFDDPRDIIGLVTIGSVFVLVLALWIAVVIIVAARRRARAEKVEQRLDLNARGNEHRTLHLWKDGKQFSTNVPGVARSRSLLAPMDLKLRQAGFAGGLASMLLMALVLMFVAGTVTFLTTKNVLLGLGVGAGVGFLIHIFISNRVTKAERVFEEQLVDAMDLAARSLRAGHPLLGAFRLISEEMPAPVSTLFSDLCQRHEMGAGLEDSLLTTAVATGSQDLKLFATSVSIQMRSGGNLADLIDRLAQVIRERMRLTRRVHVLTAQTQLSKRVLLGLPFILFIVLNMLNPDYMLPLYTTNAGQLLIALGVVQLAVGAWIMNRLAEVKY